VYGPTTAATDEEMERFYQDSSQAVKQVRNGRLQRQSRQKRAIYNVIRHWVVWLRRNEWSRWAARRLLLGARDGSGQHHVQTTSKAAVYMDLSWWQHPESDRLHLDCAKMENKLDELSHVSRSRLRHRSSIARGDCESQTGRKTKTTQHSASESRGTQGRESSAVSAEVSNRFTALEAAHGEVTPEDRWKGTKTVLLEVARETTGSVKSQKKKK